MPSTALCTRSIAVGPATARGAVTSGSGSGSASSGSGRRCSRRIARIGAGSAAARARSDRASDSSCRGRRSRRAECSTSVTPSKQRERVLHTLTGAQDSSATRLSSQLCVRIPSLSDASRRMADRAFRLGHRGSPARSLERQVPPIDGLSAATAAHRSCLTSRLRFPAARFCANALHRRGRRRACGGRMAMGRRLRDADTRIASAPTTGVECSVGLTLIRKSEGSTQKKNPRIALVLAGGAVSGGAFKVGGLKALNDFFVERKVTDMDIYVGLSAGAILGASLAAGITPDEMIKVLDGTQHAPRSAAALRLLPPELGASSRAARPSSPTTCSPTSRASPPTSRAGLPGPARRGRPAAREFVRSPPTRASRRWRWRCSTTCRRSARSRRSPTTSRAASSTTRASSAGCAAASRRSRCRTTSAPSSASASSRLYITACDLDTAERVIFGADENCELTISQAVQASTALPIFYKPARINGVDYVDGGVRHTANIDVAIEKGADLIICYNPFRPFLNRVDDDEGAQGLLRGRPLPRRSRSQGRDQPGVPHAAALAAEARDPALPERRPLPGRHRAARAARARRELLRDQPARVLEARRRGGARLRVGAHDGRAELRAARRPCSSATACTWTAPPRGAAPSGRASRRAGAARPSPSPNRSRRPSPRRCGWSAARRNFRPPRCATERARPGLEKASGSPRKPNAACRAVALRRRIP